jgi:hypothetical protein
VPPLGVPSFFLQATKPLLRATANTAPTRKRPMLDLLFTLFLLIPITTGDASLPTLESGTASVSYALLSTGHSHTSKANWQDTSFANMSRVMASFSVLFY